jgi:MFS transporter, ACS family, solute carrier family 17 (sodium-dependent inorganic phosphate cotransporter), other
MAAPLQRVNAAPAACQGRFPVSSTVTAPVARRVPERLKLVVLCVVAVFICYIDRVNISVAVIAMQEEYGWSDTVKGFVMSSFFIGYMLFMAPSGWLANRIGGRRVLGFAVVWWSVWTMLTPVAAAWSLGVLIMARIALGLGEAATFPAIYNLYGRWVPTAERSRAVSAMVAAIPIGTLFALTTTGWIIEHYGWPMVFYAFGALGILWGLVWYPLSHDHPHECPRMAAEERALLAAAAPAQTLGEPVPWGKILRAPAVWALIINHLCANWVFYMLLAWLPSYFRSTLGLSIAQSGLYAAGPWLTMFVVGTTAGWCADWVVKRGVDLTLVRKTMQVAGLLGAAVFMLAARDVTSANLAFGLMCGALGALAFTWSGFLPNHLEIAPRYADVLMGLSNTAGTVPGIIGVAVTGWLVDVTGTYTAAFILAAAINFVGAAVWLACGTAKKVID